MSARPELVQYSTVVAEPVVWIWDGYFPGGMLSLLDGDPGLGKSTLTADLAARISTGRRMPDGTGGGQPRGVVLQSHEDDRARTIRPRLDAAGADLDRVFTLDLRESGDISGPARITPEGLRLLRETIVANDVALVVFDPLTAYLPDGLDTNRDANVRRALSPLTRLAEETGCAILGLRHLRKSPSDNPLYRGGGSIAFTGAARAVYLMAADPDEPGGSRRVFAPIKMNVARLPASLAFRLVVEGAGGFPRLLWEGPSHHTAASLSALPIPGRRDSARSRAAEVLGELLEDGPVPTTEVYRRAAEQGVSERTLDRARDELGVKSHKLGGPGERSHWVLYLPKDANIVRRAPTPQAGILREDLASFEPGEAGVAVEDDFPQSAWDSEKVPA
jgi:hypothetical protein